jgi:hypothetical protein
MDLEFLARAWDQFINDSDSDDEWLKLLLIVISFFVLFCYTDERTFETTR